MATVLDNKWKNPHRWLIVGLVVLTSIGHYFCNQLPSSLEKFFQDKSDTGYQYNKRQTATLYSITFYPAAISSIIGGLVCDKYGIARSRVYFYLISTIGQFIVTIGCLFRYYEIMLIGRFIYGITSEAYQVSCMALISKYFINAEIFVGWTCCVSIGRITTSIAYKLSPILMDLFQVILNDNIHDSITGIMFSGSMVMIIGVIASIVVLVIDTNYYSDEPKKLDHETFTSETVVSHGLFAGLKEFSSTYWILVLLVIPTMYLVTKGWLVLAPQYLSTKFDFDAHQAGDYAATIAILPAFFGPLFAYFVDLKGNRAYWLISAGLILSIGQIMFCIASTTELCIVSTLILSIGYSIPPSVVWPCIRFVVEEQQYIGKAVGIGVGMVSLGLAIIPPFVGWLVDLNDGWYDNAEIVWISVISLGFFSSIWLAVDDKNHNQVLFE